MEKPPPEVFSARILALYGEETSLERRILALPEVKWTLSGEESVFPPPLLLPRGRLRMLCADYSRAQDGERERARIIRHVQDVFGIEIPGHVWADGAASP